MQNTNARTGIDEDIVEVDSEVLGVWPDKNETILIELMEEEVQKGNRPTTTFSKPAWRHIKEELNKRSGKEYTDNQLRNKFNQLRSKQKNFKLLLKETGVGWNSTTGTVTAPPDVWERLGKVNKHATRFKKRGCKHYEKLCRIFGDTMATGANAHPSTMSPSDSEDEIETGLNNPTHPLDNVDEDLEVPIGTSQRRARSATPGPSRRGKRECFTSAITNALASFNETSKRRADLMEKRVFGIVGESGSDNVAASMAASATARNHMKECMMVLTTIEGIDGATYAKTIEKLYSDPLWRDIFLDMPEDRRKDWVLNI